MPAGGFRIYKLCMRNIAWDCCAFSIRAAWLRQFTFMQLLHSRRSRRDPRERGILFGAPGVTVYCINRVYIVRWQCWSTAKFRCRRACASAAYPGPARRDAARAPCASTRLWQRSFLSHTQNSAGMYEMHRKRERKREPGERARP